MSPCSRASHVDIVVAVVACTLLCAAPARPQDRMPPIAAERMTDEQKKAVADFRAARGADVTGPFIPLLRSPEAMTRIRAMGDYFRYKTRLTPQQSELVILMTARSWAQQYEWNVHYPIAIQAGVDPDIAKAIADWRRPSTMSEAQGILYDFCDELTRNQSVRDATYARMVSAFGEAGVIDTVGIVGYYTMLAMVLNTARTPAPDNGVPALPRLPRR
jgi:4-carboxymuconolactone decarboxylase